MTKYDYQTVGPNNDPCDGWCVVKYAENCHPQKIAEGLTRSEAAMMAAAYDLLAALKGALVEIEEAWLAEGVCFGPDRDIDKKIKAAIARAEGTK